MNRFAEMDKHLKQKREGHCHAAKKSRQERQTAATTPASKSMSIMSLAFAADDRALVILLENGGIDLGIPALVDRLIGIIPGLSTLIPDSFRQDLVNKLRKVIKEKTDHLLETAELTINRYSAATPSLFKEVAILRDGTATYQNLKDKLISLSKAGKIIDVLILTHGDTEFISVPGGVDANKIRQMKRDYGKPLSIRSVYMMNCKGSSLNQAWLDAGAKASCGTVRNNYLPEPTTFFFWDAWKSGQSFENAATSAYRKTITLMNETVKSILRGFANPLVSKLADYVDFANFDFVADSAPVIQGQGSVRITSDNLSFTQSLSDSMAVTVVPTAQLSARREDYSLSASMSARTGDIESSFSYVSPSVVMQQSEYSLQQNPGALVVAGVEVADAAQIGLAAVGVVQAQYAASQGAFTLAYDKVQRLLTTEARMKMPGAQSSKKTYSHQLFFIGKGDLIVVDFAKADIYIEWEGNAYGEIGTPIIQRKLSSSTEWSKSSATLTITRVAKIPLPNTDPRAWPIVFNYVGTFDPAANGYFEFNGEFEINAFGGLKFNRHIVVSRSFADFAVIGKPEDYVQKGQDVTVAVPSIPQEQIDYLKLHLP